MLTEKEVEVLAVLDQFVIARGRQIAILVGNRETTVVRKRINKLEKEGFVRFIWKDGCKAYFLSQRGLQELERSRKEYNPVGYSTEHKIYVTEVATYVHIKYGINYKCMAEDKMFKNIRLKHAPDLAVGNTCYEVELNTKSHNRLEKNIKANGENWNTQIWIVPERKHGLRANIETVAKKNGYAVKVIPLEEILRYVKEADLSGNSLGQGIELELKHRPIKREEEIFE